jgi:hypothetical protein
MQCKGYSVSCSDDAVAVGSPGHSMIADRAGAVYVFEAMGLSQQHKYTQLANASSASVAAGSDFGCSVAVSSNALVVGADGARGATDGTGALYVATLHWIVVQGSSALYGTFR